MERRPGARFLEGRRELLGMESRVVTLEEASRLHFHALRPWGWSPRVHGMLDGIPADEGGREEWGPGKKELYSRVTALSVLTRVRGDLELPEAIFPRVEESVEGVAVQARRQAVVMKAPWSSSGRGVLMVGPGEISREERAWLSGVLRGQGYVTVEKRLDKASDFALEFWIEGSGDVRYMGLSQFFTGEKGNYQGNYTGPQACIEQEITRYVGEPLFRATRESVTRALRDVFGGKYRGPLGVDMMLYRDEEGAHRLHPCVEINSRYTMGIVALNLSGRYLAPGSEGIFRVSCFPRAGEAYRACRERAEESPARVEAGRLLSGYLPLTPVDEDTRFVAELTCHERGKRA
jgi:hypothetical protein